MTNLSPTITPSVRKPLSSLTVTRLSDVAGGEIRGLDLSKSITSQTCNAILDAFVEHHVLVFRDQDLTKDEQHAFTLNFGELEQHVGRFPDGSRYPVVHTVTNLDSVTGKPTPTPNTHGNYFWHTDKSYHAVPSLTTLLHAVSQQMQARQSHYETVGRQIMGLDSSSPHI